MRVVRICLVVLLALACVACISRKAIDGLLAREEIREALAKPAEAPPASLVVCGRVPVVHLYGTPREMGTQYGQLLGRALRALHRAMDAFVSQEAKERMLQLARRRERALPQEVREELKAVAKASGMPYDELVALNVTSRLACSALAVWGRARGRGGDPNTAGLIMGRNADYFSMGFSDRGMLLVVRHPREGVPVASVNFLGMVGAFTGINAHGVCFGNMLVFNAAGSQQNNDGLTIQLAMRLAAQRSRTAKDMAKLLTAQKHAIPMNVMIADPNEAQVLELGLRKVQVRRSRDGILAASNYFLTPRLRTKQSRCRRYDSLLAAARKHRGQMTVEKMTEALYEARVQGLNLQAVVFEPTAMRMHVSINHMPAAKGPYVQFDLKKLFAQPPSADKD
ncbi:MAG TPA: C45 family peptidase [Phycisphaerae bacterium]|nr:C45 family peptidase [Phycisphaerae bacterium]HUT60412.1 C45 family peptidase [Phycisphaerae bacterium]